MAILQWNIRGFRANKEELLLLMNDLKPGVVALQETFIAADKSVHITGYNVVSSPAVQTGAGGLSGGVLFLLKNSLLYSEVDLSTNLQAVAVRVSLHKTITFCNIYLPPSVPIHKQQLVDLLEQLPKPFVLLGDLNGHSYLWGSDFSSSRGTLLEDLFNDFDLCILNDGSPTHFTTATGSFSCLDLSVCDPSLVLDFEWKVHDNLHGSDHFPVLLSPISAEPISLPERFLFGRANWFLYSSKIESKLNESNVLKSNDPVQSLTSIILDCAKMSIPVSSCSPQLPKVPWFNAECKKAHAERKKAQRLVFRKPCETNVRAHQKLRAKARYVFKKSKKESWRKFVSSLSSKVSSKKIWKIIKKIKGKNKNPSFHHLKLNDCLITEKQAVANVIASTIQSNSSSANKSRIFSKIEQEHLQKPCNFQSDNTEPYNLPFSLNELKSALQKCTDSAVGPDGIHYNLLKHIPESGLNILLAVFNHIWCSGFFPPSWKTAHIIPISKPGKDPSNPSNYRPIALTSCLCKLMERMVNSRLMWFLETEDLLSSKQCGFRRHHSTIDHLVRLESTVRNAFINKKHVVAIFFDMEKAYDTTWKNGILSDLYDLGFRGFLPCFIKNFLDERLFQVRLGTTLSDIYEQEQGVPQGSILSPALFSIKINKIVDSVRQGSDCSLFVDDFGLYAVGSTYPRVQRELQMCVDRIQQWVEENGFTFSTSKTECIHFHNFRSFFPDPEIKLKSSIIKAVTEAKFLGVIFDQKLNFRSHINYLKTSCQSALNALKVVANTDWGADRRTLLRLYQALVRSKLDYGCIVYGSTRASYLKSLDPIHHQGLRLCLGAFRTTPVYSLYAEAGEPSLTLRRLKLSMNYYVKLHSEPCNPAYDCVMNPPFKKKYLDSPNVIPPLGLRLLPHLEEAGIDVGVISDFSKFPDQPPWTFLTPEVRFDLTSMRKDSTSSLVYKAMFADLCSQLPSYDQIFTDGSKTDEGVACAAFQQSSDRSCTKSIPSDGSVYSAELTALALGLQLVQSSDPGNFLICTDSLSALEAISNRNLNHPELISFFKLFTELSLNSYKIVLAWVPGHVGIRGNEKADNLAKDTTRKKPRGTLIPHSDLKPKVSKYVNNLWQEEWSGQSSNKLFEIRPDLHAYLPSSTSGRKEESVLCRLHTGHTHLTHSYLLKGEDPPWCVGCHAPLTVRHILIDCWDLYDVRRKHFTAESMKVLFRDVPPGAIFDFLREVNLFQRL